MGRAEAVAQHVELGNGLHIGRARLAGNDQQTKTGGGDDVQLVDKLLVFPADDAGHAHAVVHAGGNKRVVGGDFQPYAVIAQAVADEQVLEGDEDALVGMLDGCERTGAEQGGKQLAACGGNAACTARFPVKEHGEGVVGGAGDTLLDALGVPRPLNGVLFLQVKEAMGEGNQLRIPEVVGREAAVAVEHDVVEGKAGVDGECRMAGVELLAGGQGDVAAVRLAGEEPTGEAGVAQAGREEHLIVAAGQLDGEFAEAVPVCGDPVEHIAHVEAGELLHAHAAAKADAVEHLRQLLAQGGGVFVKLVIEINDGARLNVPCPGNVQDGHVGVVKLQQGIDLRRGHGAATFLAG